MLTGEIRREWNCSAEVKEPSSWEGRICVGGVGGTARGCRRSGWGGSRKERNFRIRRGFADQRALWPSPTHPSVKPTVSIPRNKNAWHSSDMQNTPTAGRLGALTPERPVSLGLGWIFDLQKWARKFCSHMVGGSRMTQCLLLKTKQTNQKTSLQSHFFFIFHKPKSHWLQ